MVVTSNVNCVDKCINSVILVTVVANTGHTMVNKKNVSDIVFPTELEANIKKLILFEECTIYRKIEP